MQSITFVIPSRNNLEFLILAYASIKKLKGDHYILFLDDASDDGTSDWITSLEDDRVSVYLNQSGHRIGIVGMFDKGISMAKTDIVCAFHADMIASPNFDVNILKHLKPQTVVSATRVEPPIHPSGPEKIISDLGNYADAILIDNVYEKLSILETENQDKTTTGIFAPWCIFKNDYFNAGGLDNLFAPQSREDSDLFNRFVLHKYQLIQSWDSLVYHFTCRGSRFNKSSGGDIGNDSNEWKNTNYKNTKNFIRKWQSVVQHDRLMNPIISPKYNIGLILNESIEISNNILEVIEPFVSNIFIYSQQAISSYIKHEQKNTIIDLSKKILDHNNIEKINNDIIIEVKHINNQTIHDIQNINHFITDINSIGMFQIDNLLMHIKRIENIIHENIDHKKFIENYYITTTSNN